MAFMRLKYQRLDGVDVGGIPEDCEESNSSAVKQDQGSHQVNSDNVEGIIPYAAKQRRGSTLPLSLHPSWSSSPLVQRRKLSIPASLHSNFLAVDDRSVTGFARRRLSNVSDVFSRKLSNTIGWRTSEAQCQEIVSVGKSLCCRYIRSRVRRSGYSLNKCWLQKVSNALTVSGGIVFREVFPDLLCLGIELERIHPKLYVNVMRQASSAPGGRINADHEPGSVLVAVFREIFKSDLSWGKLISLYAVSGGLAVDCIKQSQNDYLVSIVEAMEEILEEELAQWIHGKGGWHALSTLVRPPTTNWSAYKILFLVSSFAFFTIFVIFVLGFYGISTFL